MRSGGRQVQIKFGECLQKYYEYFWELSGTLVFVRATFIFISSLWISFPMVMFFCCFEIYRISL